MEQHDIEVEIREHGQTDDGPIIVAELRGRITVSEADRFAQKAELITSPQPAVAILDCSRLGFLSSAGIGELIKLQRAIAAKKSKLFLVAVQPEVMKLLEQSRLDEMMPMYGTLDEAMLHVN